jgi:hypothetical protein
VRYIELMLPVLCELLGDAAGVYAGRRAARLVGLQLHRDTTTRLGIRGRSRAEAVALVAAIHRGTGNTVATVDTAGGRVRLERFRLGGGPQVLTMWSALLEGLLAAHDRRLSLVPEACGGWRVV